MTTIEVFADITCPFTHVGLKRVVARLASLGGDSKIIVRAWPLEWVNGVPLDADAVAMKAGVMTDQMGVTDFNGFDRAQWPESTIPALNLAAAAYEKDHNTGLAASLKLRALVFEQGMKVDDPKTLGGLAQELGIADWAYSTEPSPQVQADYDDGTKRKVRGSPDFWVGPDEFFCPSLTIGHDDDGALTSEFDPEGLDRFIERAVADRA